MLVSQVERVEQKVVTGFHSHWVVDTRALKEGNWMEACSCGRTASRNSLCDHCILVIGHSGLRECITTFLKPWQTVQAWDAQVQCLH